MSNNIGVIAQEVGKINDDGSIRFLTGSTYEWKVVSWQGRFAVCKFSNERMRITASGDVMFGSDLQTPDNALEVYWFNTREWAGLARRRLIAIEGIPDDIKYKMVKPIQLSFGGCSTYTMTLQPDLSDWSCYLFGNTPGGGGMVYKPTKENVPNAVVRWFMKVCLGCNWVKQ